MQHVLRVGLGPLRSLRPRPRTPLLRSLCTGTPKPGAMVSRPAADAAQQMPDVDQLNFHLNLEKLTGSITETTTDGTDDADTNADGHRMGPPSAVSARALAYDPDAPASGMNMEQLLDFFRAADDDVGTELARSCRVTDEQIALMRKYYVLPVVEKTETNESIAVRPEDAMQIPEGAVRQVEEGEGAEGQGATTAASVS